VALVVKHLKIFKLVVEDGIRLALDVKRGVGKWLAAELQGHLLMVVAVNVAVAAGPDEVTHIQVTLLGHHVGEQGVAGDVEGHAQKDVGTALVQLAAELGFFARVLCRRHIELKERMARHERHFVELGHVPSAHDDAAAVGVAFERVDDLLNLVNVTAIRRGPAAPLHAIHGAEVAVFASPFVPNRHVTFFEPVVVARTCQEPQQLLNDGAQVNLFGGDQREAFVEVKPHLVAKHALGARASAVGLGNALAGHVLHEVFVLTADGAHKGNLVKNCSEFKC
jgi:hypothetical protein